MKGQQQTETNISREIFFCGDLHGGFNEMISAVLRYRPLAVILLGDIMGEEPAKSLDQELAEILDLTDIWFIHGNHDTDSQASYEALFNSPVLGSCNLHGRVVEVAGLRIAGVGGVIRGRIWNLAQSDEYSFKSYEEYFRYAEQKRPTRLRNSSVDSNEDRKHRSTIFPDVIEHLSANRADILVTHEAGEYHPMGFSTLSQLGRDMGVHTSFHGHMHETRTYPDYMYCNAHGVGLRGIVALNIDSLKTSTVLSGDKRYMAHPNDETENFEWEGGE